MGFRNVNLVRISVSEPSAFGLRFCEKGFPSWWRVSLLPGLLDIPSQVCLPQHDTLLPLSHFIHEWECLPGVSLWVLRTVWPGYTLQFGRNPPPPCFDGVQLTVVNSTSKASVLQQKLSVLSVLFCSVLKRHRERDIVRPPAPVQIAPELPTVTRFVFGKLIPWRKKSGRNKRGNADLDCCDARLSLGRSVRCIEQQCSVLIVVS